MRRVKSLKIGAVTYKVIWKKNLKDDNGRIIYGRCNSLKYTIEINTSQSDEMILWTLFHEAFHIRQDCCELYRKWNTGEKILHIRLDDLSEVATQVVKQVM